MTADYLWNLLAKKLSGEADEAELKELDELLLANPEGAALANTLSAIWQQSPEHNDPEALMALAGHVQRIKKAGIEFEEQAPGLGKSAGNTVLGRLGKKWWIPAGVLTLSALLFYLKPSHHPAKISLARLPVSQVSTKAGSRTQLRLPDGSVVWLNASSNLTYNENFGKNVREVNLVGEAFFVVSKDSLHPFIIHTKAIDIKVLGTEFNVKAYPNDAYTETSLIRGSVEVTVKGRGEKHYLRPNQKVIVANEIVESKKTAAPHQPLIALTGLTRATDSTIEETSWVQNKLVFQNESFSDLAIKMERWYGVTIIFKNEKVEALRFTGVFEKETIQQALEALQITANFHFNVKESVITVT